MPSRRLLLAAAVPAVIVAVLLLLAELHGASLAASATASLFALASARVPAAGAAEGR
ncbi:MAG: hypothetical protein L6R43_05405 [Planctomycetes bacterium]|nr:hypothetical protein [Planctomycetota bacterium]